MAASFDVSDIGHGVHYSVTEGQQALMQARKQLTNPASIIKLEEYEQNLIIYGRKGMVNKMAEVYNHREVETKWQKVWDDEKAFKTSDDYSKPKYYALVEFPYPSGQ